MTESTDLSAPPAEHRPARRTVIESRLEEDGAPEVSVPLRVEVTPDLVLVEVEGHGMVGLEVSAARLRLLVWDQDAGDEPAELFLADVAVDR